jgi:hypothetical protein
MPRPPSQVRQLQVIGSQVLSTIRGSPQIMAEAKDSRGIEMAPATSHQQDDIEDIKPAAGKIKEVQGDSHFYETVTAAPLDPLSRTSIQLYLILLVAALNATTSGFDGVSLADPDVERGWLNLRVVNLQLYQRDGPVPGIFPSHGARIKHWNVSSAAESCSTWRQRPENRCLTSATASS